MAAKTQSLAQLINIMYSTPVAPPIQAPQSAGYYRMYGATRRRKRQRKRDQHGLVELTKDEIEKLPDPVKEGRYKKKWVRLDLGTTQKQRVWKNATFLTNDLFATRLQQKRGALLYHICYETRKHIMYARTIIGEEHCSECEARLPDGAQMLLTLQKLAPSRGK